MLEEIAYVIFDKSINKYIKSGKDFTDNINEAKVFKSIDSVKRFVRSYEISEVSTQVLKVKTQWKVEVIEDGI